MYQWKERRWKRAAVACFMTLYQHLCSLRKRNSKKDLSDNEAVAVDTNRNADLLTEEEELQELGVITLLGTLQ